MEPASLPTILYCHCQYAQVVPKEVKDAVLRSLCDSGIPFEAVADLCEMSARKDPALQRFAASGAVKIAACYPRAVKWLFHSANAPLDADSSEVLNMRTLSGEAVTEGLLRSPLQPNLPRGKVTMSRSEVAAPAGENSPGDVALDASHAPAV